MSVLDLIPENYSFKSSVVNYSRVPIQNSSELTRVLSIPRRTHLDLDSDKALALVEIMTTRLAKQGVVNCNCLTCIKTLKPSQALALFEAPLAQGLLAPIGVGHGKTGLNILMPMVFKDCKLAVLFVPSALKKQLLRAYHEWGIHFETPSIVCELESHIQSGKPVLYVLAFSKFSRKDSTNLLDRLKPDLIIVDEAHKLRHKDTATTSRVLHYLSKNPGTRLCCWSGTLTSKSIKDYAHLSAFALKENSPLPLAPAIVESWATALDPSDNKAPVGALFALCQNDENIYQGFYRRLTETRGVVATRSGAIDASILITERHIETPQKIKDAIKDLQGSWVRPDGEELIDKMSVARSAKQLASGFFYRWKFPNGEPVTLIDKWFKIRQQFNKELRAKLAPRTQFLDSYLLCCQAAKRAYQEIRYDGPLPVWESTYFLEWEDIKNKVYHETHPVWIDDFLVNDAALWARKNKGIVWYEFDAFGERLQDKHKIKKYGGGTLSEQELLQENGTVSFSCSIKAHGTGKDGLQKSFCNQLVANPPTNGAQWEQLLGRLHRIGQESDTVQTTVYRHTGEFAEGIDRAIVQAKYIQGTLGTLQKLLVADYDFFVDIEKILLDKETLNS